MTLILVLVVALVWLAVATAVALLAGLVLAVDAEAEWAGWTN